MFNIITQLSSALDIDSNYNWIIVLIKSYTMYDNTYIYGSAQYLI